MPFAKTPKIQPEILRDKIYRVICDSIVTGQFRPGEALVESVISQQLGVSRIPVREAFYLLEKNGYIRMIPHKGAFVTMLTRKEIEDLVEVRELFETWVLCGAREKLQPGDLQKLEQLIVEMDKAAAAQDYVTFYSKDMELHGQIWRAKGNKKAEEMLHTACVSFMAFITMLYASRSQKMEVPLADHRRLVELLKAGANGEALRDWVKNHIGVGKALALEFAENQPRQE